MVLKVYVSSISGSMEIKKQQEFVFQILQTHKVEFDKVDITDPSNEEEKMFMRQHSVPKDGQKNPLPPQIFNDTEYCGDYDALYDANECEEVLQFLKLEDESPVSKQSVILAETEPAAARQVSDDDADGVTSTTKVSSVTLGVLSARSEDINQNVNKAEQSSVYDDDVNHGIASPGSDPDAVTVSDDDKAAPETTQSQYRSSIDNVRLSSDGHDTQIDNNRVSTSSLEQADGIERHDDTLSLPDSIEGSAEKDNVGDSTAVDVTAEQ